MLARVRVRVRVTVGCTLLIVKGTDAVWAHLYCKGNVWLHITARTKACVGEPRALLRAAVC